MPMKAFQLAARTFSQAGRASPEALKKSIDTLVVHMDRLTGSDVGLELCSALQESGNSPSNTLDGPESEDRSAFPAIKNNIGKFGKSPGTGPADQSHP